MYLNTKNLFLLIQEEKNQYHKQLRDYVVQNQDLNKLIADICRCC